MDTNSNKIGNKIKSIRLSQGETMEKFGKRFNTSKGTVNNWEKGRNLPNKENLLKIAKLGDMTVDELLLIESENKYDLFFEQKINKMNKHDFEVVMQRGLSEEKYNLIKSNIAIIKGYYQEKTRSYTIFDKHCAETEFKYALKSALEIITHDYTNLVRTKISDIFIDLALLNKIESDEASKEKIEKIINLLDFTVEKLYKIDDNPNGKQTDFSILFKRNSN